MSLTLCVLCTAAMPTTTSTTVKPTTPPPKQNHWCKHSNDLGTMYFNYLEDLDDLPGETLTNMTELVDATCQLTLAYSLLYNSNHTTDLQDDLKTYLSQLCQEVSTLRKLVT